MFHGRQRAANGRKARNAANAGTYDNAWRMASIAHRRANPFCVVCLSDGVWNDQLIQVDHIVPIVEDSSRRLDPTNWQSLCRRHHSEKSARENGLGKKLD